MQVLRWVGYHCPLSTVSGHQGCNSTAHMQEPGLLCNAVVCPFWTSAGTHGSHMGCMWLSEISWDILDGNRCLHKDTGLSAGSPSCNSSSAFSSSTPTHRHQSECALIHEPDPILRFFSCSADHKEHSFAAHVAACAMISLHCITRAQWAAP